MNIQGRCNCGEISFEINGEIKNVVNCHCNFCRRMNGSSFSTYAITREDDFKLTSGDLSLKHYKVSSNAQKFFCSNCGSPIYNSNPKYAGVKIVHLGILDDAAKYAPQVNIYCDSKLNWLEDIFKIKSFSEDIKKA